jgi:exodeoxyribonuclease VII large subunit
MTLPLFPDGEGRPAPRRVTLIRLAGEIARSIATIGKIAVEGEVHRPTRTATGRVYFTLRDRVAQLTVTCPPGKAARCRTVAGERVCVVGALSWTNERGALVLIAEEVSPVGEGAIAAQINEARARLREEGLLDRPRRPLPRLPRAIGVLCGTEAAVRADIESVVAVRFPGYPVVFSETNVSAPGAAQAITESLRALWTVADVEVIIMARGGGDAVQLLPFSDEELCRAICDSPVPIVSAIGHEGDRPLCDEVADLRCGIPSLAAAAVVPDQAALTAQLTGLRQAVLIGTRAAIERSAGRLETIEPWRALASGMTVATERLGRVAHRMPLLHPTRQLPSAGQRLAALDHRAPMRMRLQSERSRLVAGHRHLEALDPTRVLARGYAIVRTADGQVLRRAADTVAGRELDVRLARGRLGVRVEEVDDDRP